MEAGEKSKEGGGGGRGEGEKRILNYLSQPLTRKKERRLIAGLKPPI